MHFLVCHNLRGLPLLIPLSICARIPLARTLYACVDTQRPFADDDRPVPSSVIGTGVRICPGRWRNEHRSI